MSAHLPTIKQLQYLVALRQHGAFRQGGGGLLRHPVDPVRGPARARNAARRHPGRAHAPRRPLHRRLGEKIADKAVRVLREAEELADMARAEGQPLHGELRMGVIPTIAPFLLPAMLPRLRERMAEPQALPARGDQPGGVRGAPSRPARLRAARPALRLRRRRQRALVRRPAVRRLSRAAKRPASARSTSTRSTRTGCCCSRTAIA